MTKAKPNFEDWNDHHVVCPYCQEVDGDVTDFPHDDLRYDGAVAEHNCGSCGRDFLIMVSISCSYAAAAKPESE